VKFGAREKPVETPTPNNDSFFKREYLKRQQEARDKKKQITERKLAATGKRDRESSKNIQAASKDWPHNIKTDNKKSNDSKMASAKSSIPERNFSTQTIVCGNPIFSTGYQSYIESFGDKKPHWTDSIYKQVDHATSSGSGINNNKK